MPTEGERLHKQLTEKIIQERRVVLMPHPDLSHRQITNSRADLLKTLRMKVYEWKKEQGEETDADFVARPIERALESIEEVNDGK